MKRFLLAASAAAALSLGGCATTTTGTTTTIATIEADVQSAAASACSFVPTIATVASIIATLFPGGSATEAIVGTIAAQICSAVAAVPVAASGRLGATAAVYYPGTMIPIHGTFVSKSAGRLRARFHR